MTPEFELDKWSDKYAQRINSMKPSAIRNLFTVTERPDLISLAGGMPETSIFDVEGIRNVVCDVINFDHDGAFQYGPTGGYSELKSCICRLMRDEGMHVHPDEVLITGGAQQALDLLGKIFINAGDEVVVEAPSYVGALGSFDSYRADYLTVELDEDGMDVAKLEELLRKRKTMPKFIYTIPNFQNPSGVTMSLDKRKKLLQIAEEYEILLVEDNPYGRLRFSGEYIPSLRSFSNEVVYLGTFSKIFSPGVRVGWIVAPTPIREKLDKAKEAADLCSSSLTQRIVTKFFQSDLWESHISRLVGVYSKRCDAMLKSLDKHFPEYTSWTKPDGGFFVWAKVPEFIDTTEMLADAISNGVAYVPGNGFFPGDRGKNYMRLAFCFVDPDKIDQGIKKLSKVIKSQVELYESLKF